MAYDFRARFGLGLSAPFDGTITWAEMWDLTSQLVRDPTAHTCAALNGWEYPISREAQALASLYDLTLVANTDSKKRNQVEPYPRPWPSEDKNRSKAPTVDQQTIREALARTRENTHRGD
ncbi:hypothetical protein [Amycolatopsis sp. NPDC003731]